MSAYAAPIAVVQAALHRTGEETIASMDEGSSAALVASSNYEGVVRSNLTRHAWLFATETSDLTLEGAVTAGDYVWSWTWPAAIINVRAVLVDGRRLRSMDYVIQGQRVLTMDAFTDRSVQVIGTVRADESKWPDDFAEAMVVRLQALFLESLADKWQDARTVKKDAESLFQAAIVRDKRQQPATTQEFNRLADAWRTSGYRSRYLG